MSLQILNKNVSSEKSTENCDFLFSPLEVTGRSSVLCESQKENVPPKNLAKAMKVTFQTPLRDPQTHRILSPSMASKLEAPLAQGDTLGLENSHPGRTQKDNSTHGVEEPPSGSPREATLVELDFLGALDAPVSTSVPLEPSTLWSEEAGCFRAYISYSWGSEAFGSVMGPPLHCLRLFPPSHQVRGTRGKGEMGSWFIPISHRFQTHPQVSLHLAAHPCPPGL
uniref:Transforming acidic coiled-coil containing protein 3 n=1 Tax=Callithrix jacchus TaxID=9483 RepID=A0A8I3WHA8_CALJA